MVRKRGVARKSYAQRRVRRVKKYDHNVIPVRFKVQLPRMAELIETALDDSVGLEPFIDAELTKKGVPTSEFPYYYGFGKRMLELYRNFTGETLQKEKESLIEEYVLRGKERHVLEQEQDVVEEYVGIVVSCDQVKACLEGDYTTYTHLWTNPYPSGLQQIMLQAFHIFEQVEYFALNWKDSATGDSRFGVYKLSDMSVIFENPAATSYQEIYCDVTPATWVHIGQTANASYGGMTASRTRYLVLLTQEAGVIEVWKDGALLQSIDLNTYVADSKHVVFHMSLNGKWLLVSVRDILDDEYLMCFQGS